MFAPRTLPLAASVVTLVALLSAPPQIGAWHVPWYLDCHHNDDWKEFRVYLGVAAGDFREELFWWSHALLERTEPLFLRIQNTKHLYFVCNPDTNATDNLDFFPRDEDESVLRLPSGTDSWTPEERERRSLFVQDFCYYGYMAAAVYRTRLLTSEIRGVLEGRTHALTLLRTLLMSRSNAIDFLDSSGWFDSFSDFLGYIWPPADAPVLSADVTLEDACADDSGRPWVELRTGLGQTVWTGWFGGVGGVPSAPVEIDGQRGGLRRWTVAAIGYHTSLVLEVVTLWTELMEHRASFEVAVHVLEPGAATAAEVRNASLCRDFYSGAHCAWDPRLLDLNRRHVRRSRLPLSGLPSPMVPDVPGFLDDFAAAFRYRYAADVPSVVDRRIDRSDLFLCTEPVLLCGAMGRAFLGRPLVGYFANPLMSYVPKAHARLWLAEFRKLAGGVGRSVGVLLPVASTRFLAEQIRYQTGVRVLAVRPLATYLGPPRGPNRKGEVVVVRAPSVFWSSACVLNDIVRANEGELAEAHVSGGRHGLAVPGLRFVASEDLADGASEAFAGFGAAALFPYDVSQMRLYELYALALPVFLPDRHALPCYIYRGMTTIEDFDHYLPNEKMSAGVEDPVPYLERNPFDRSNWHAVSAWAELTHWQSLPHLLHCAGVAHMLLRVVREDLRTTTAGMRRRQEIDLLRTVDFWASALNSLDGGVVGNV